jgi:hypothetical protein
MPTAHGATANRLNGPMTQAQLAADLLRRPWIKMIRNSEAPFILIEIAA